MFEKIATWHREWRSAKNDDSILAEKDHLGWNEKIPLGLALIAQSYVIFNWYFDSVKGIHINVDFLIAIAAGIALDLIVVTTTMGRREGRESNWSHATAFGAFVCSALIALNVYGAIPWIPEGWLHIAFPLEVWLYSQHLATPKRARKDSRAATTVAVATTQAPDIDFTKVAADVTLDDLLRSMGKTREEALALLHRYGLMDTAPKYAYQALQRYSTLPDNLTEERFAVLLIELKTSAPAAKAIPVTRPTLLQELVGDVKEEVLAPARDTSLSIRERVVVSLESNPLLEDAELYALLPDKKPGSIRVYSSAWRKENADRIASAKSLVVANGNGRH